MQEAAVEGRCRCCGVEVEQPRSGSRQKLFCSDEHRLRYWRERRKQGLPTGEDAGERQTDVRSLTWELQATLQGFERTVVALGRALAESGDLDAARAVREQVEAEAQRRVAAAEERRARAERLRLEAEALAEAAEAEVREAHRRLQEMEARVRQAEAEVRAAGEREGAVRQRLEEEMAAVRQVAKDEGARAREEAQVAVGAVEAEARRVTEVLEGVRGQLQVVDRELAEQRGRGTALEQRLQEAEADSRGRAAQHASHVEALREELREAAGGLAAERETRLRAEERAQAAGALAEERARERDRLVEAGGRRPGRRRRARPRAGAG
jgi:chromosome segregation ATPase